MKMVKGVFIILLFYFIGQFISHLINGFIPGNIIGMLLLFTCLYFKVVAPENVRDISYMLTKNMAIFFIPAGAGLIGSLGLISKYWVSIVVASCVSTVLVIVVVAIIQQKMEDRRNRQ